MPSWHRSEEHRSSAGTWHLGCTGPPRARVPFRHRATYICRWRYEYLSGRNRNVSTAVRAQAFKEVPLPGLAGSPPGLGPLVRTSVCCFAGISLSLLTVRRGIHGAHRHCLPPQPSFQTLQRGPPWHIPGHGRWMVRVRAVQAGRWHAQLAPQRRTPFLCWDLAHRLHRATPRESPLSAPRHIYLPLALRISH
jgi:hypothetical protein